MRLISFPSLAFCLTVILAWTPVTAAEAPFVIKHGNQSLKNFLEKTDDGAIKGIHRDLVDELARRMNLATSHRICPFSRCMRMLYNGALDVILYLAATPERAQHIELIFPWDNPAPIYFFTRKGENHKLQNYQDLYDFRIGAVNGYIYSPGFDSDEKITRTVILEESQLPKMLAAGRIDAFPVFMNQFSELSKLYPDIALAPLQLPQWQAAMIGVSKKSPLMNRITEIKQTLRAMAEDGSLDKLWQKYYAGQSMPYTKVLLDQNNN